MLEINCLSNTLPSQAGTGLQGSQPERNPSNLNPVTLRLLLPVDNELLSWEPAPHLNLLWENSFPQGSKVPLVNNRLTGSLSLSSAVCGTAVFLVASYTPVYQEFLFAYFEQ